MFSRRLATFVLGIWIGCCALVDITALEAHHVASQILDNPSVDVKEVLTKSGTAAVPNLLHHLAAEQMRATMDNWESAQLILALFMLVTLVFTEQRKLLAIAMCAAMGILVTIQHFIFTPDLAILGRSVDFVAESASFSVRAQIRTLSQFYAGLETIKLLIGGILASYFFAMESNVKRSKTRRTRAGDEALGAPVR